ncbi:MAG: PAS domain S-box protein [bacterium]|nr:PAS domain S-box protein [bacterium]
MEKKHRILIVEDERIAAEDLRLTLSQLGYEVAGLASSGEEALRLAGLRHPDLVLMDIVLKGPLNGIGTARAMTERFGLPVVYVTAFSDADTIERIKSTHPYGYLHKPFDFKELHVVIETALVKHRADRLLAQREEWFSTTLRSIGDAVLTLDSGGRITFMNGTASRLTGWDMADASGLPVERVFRIVSEESGRPVENPVRKVLRDGRYAGLADHTLLIRKDGLRIPIDDSGAPIRDDRGRLTGAVLVFKEISERRKAESEIRQLSRFPAENPNPVMRVDKAGVLLYANPASGRLLDEWDCRVGGKVPAFARRWTRQALSTGKPRPVDARAGEVIYSLNVTPVPEEGYVNLYGNDVTIQRQVDSLQRRYLREQTLLSRASRILTEESTVEPVLARLGEILREESGADFVLINGLDESGAGLKPMLWLGPKARTGMARRHFKRDPFDVSVPLAEMPGDRLSAYMSRRLVRLRSGLHGLCVKRLPEPACRSLERALGIREIWVMGMVSRRKLHGSVSFLFREKRVLQNAQLVETLVNHAAVLVQHRTEADLLAESEKRFRRIVETAMEGIWILDRSDRTTFVNRRMAGLLGYTVREMMNRPAADFLFSRDLPDHVRRTRRRRTGRSERYVRILRARDGSPVGVSVSATPIFDTAGRFDGSFSMFLRTGETPDRKRAPARMRKTPQPRRKP